MTPTSTKKLGLASLILIFFTILSRCYWLWHHRLRTDFYLSDGSIPFLTTDSYEFFNAIRNVNFQLQGTQHIFGIWVDLPILIYQITGWNIHDILFYLPMALACVLPLSVFHLCCKLMGAKAALAAGAFSAIAHTFYNRSTVGYYDSDTLAIATPVAIAAFLIHFSQSQKAIHLIIGSALLVFYPYFYYSYEPLNLAIFVAILFSLLIKHRDLFFISFFCLSLAYSFPNEPLILIPIVIASLLHKRIKVGPSIKVLGYLIAIMTLGQNFNFDSLQLWKYRFYAPEEKIEKHLTTTNDTPNTTPKNLNAAPKQQPPVAVLHNPQSKKILEAKNPPILTAFNRMGGHPAVTILTLMAFLYGLWKFPLLISTLPLLGIALMSLQLGTRFTLYATPISAIGLGIIVHFISNTWKQKTAILASVLITIICLSPNIHHILNFTPAPFIKPQQIKTLKDIEKNSRPEDIVFSWWDYGTIIRTYTNRGTYLPFNGSQHPHTQVYSLILRSPSDHHAANFTQLAFQQQNINNYLLQEGYGNDREKFQSFDQYPKEQLPNNAHQSIFFLTMETFFHFPTIYQYSNIDYSNGSELQPPIYFPIHRYEVSERAISLSNGWVIDRKNFNITTTSGKKVDLGKAFIAQYDDHGRLITNQQTFNPQSKLNLIFLPHYHLYLILEDELLHSRFIQWFAFEKLDPDSPFQFISKNPLAKALILKP